MPSKMRQFRCVGDGAGHIRPRQKVLCLTDSPKRDSTVSSVVETLFQNCVVTLKHGGPRMVLEISNQKTLWFQMNRSHRVETEVHPSPHTLWELRAAGAARPRRGRLGPACFGFAPGSQGHLRETLLSRCVLLAVSERGPPAQRSACLRVWAAGHHGRQKREVASQADNIRHSQRKPQLFPLDCIIFYFTTDQSC